jgi:uncharacterized phage protein (TIGR02220 family)
MGYRYTKIKTSIWHNEKFRALSEHARTLFLYFLSYPHSNILGCYVVPPEYILHDLQWEKKRLKLTVLELSRNGFITLDEGVNLVFITNHFKHNYSLNPNQIKSAANLLKELPKSPMFADVCKMVPEPLRKGFESLSISVAVTGAVTGTVFKKKKALSSNGKKDTRPHLVSKIIDDLNEKTGKKFKATTKSTQRLIQARLNEGFTLDDFCEVHRKKTKQWKGDPKFESYLRPETLYASSHFDSYLNEPEPTPSKDLDQPPVIYTDKAAYEKATAEGKMNILFRRT